MRTDFLDPCVSCKLVCPGSNCPVANTEEQEGLPEPIESIIVGASLPAENKIKTAVKTSPELPEKMKLLLKQCGIQTPRNKVINIKRENNLVLITVGKGNIATAIKNYSGRFTGEVNLHYRAGILIKIVSKKDR